MESVWYYVVNGAQVGPVSLSELKAAAATGKLTPPDLVWKEGTADWVPARTVPELFPATPPPAAGPPQPIYSLSPGVSPPPPYPQAVAPAAVPLSLDDEPEKAARVRTGARVGAPRPTPEWVKLIPVFLRRAYDPDPARLAPVPDEEAALTRCGVMDVTAREFAVWRRAVLFVAAAPCAVAALLGLVHLMALDSDRTEMFGAFGLFLQYVQALSLFALPAAAVLGARAYDRLSASAAWVLLGGAVAVAVPLGVALVPGDWVIESRASGSTTVGELEKLKAGYRVSLGVVSAVGLAPLVLALSAAASRAGVRMKLLVPESVVPGWALVAGVPVLSLMSLVAFVSVYDIGGNALLLIALVLWLGAPLMFLAHFALFTRPLRSPADGAALVRTSLVVFGVTAFGIALLVIDLFTARVGSAGKTLVGFDESTSVLRPWSLEIHKRLIEYVGRALFLSVLFADLLLRAVLSVWRDERAFAGTPGAAALDRTLSGLGSAVLPRGSGERGA
jgi:hypothetical protein